MKQVYEQLKMATSNQSRGSKWRGQIAMKEEEGEGRRAMKAGAVSDGVR